MSVFGTDEDLYFGSVYVPPSESRFNTADEMSLFDAEITSMCIAHKYVSLIGDFNARTHNKIDFMDADDFLSRHFEFDVDVLEIYNSSDIFNRFSHISRERTSQDIVFNNEGKLLLDTCRTNNLIILNGPCGSDNSKGAFTFRNCSVIDYSIASHNFLKHVQDFNVIDLDPIFSDGHSLICTTFCFKHFVPVCYIEPTDINQAPSRPKWKPENKHQFLNSLDKNKINDLYHKLQESERNLNNVTKQTVTDMCNIIPNIFVDANNSIHNGSNPTQTYYNEQTQRQWFGNECRSARTKYHLAKKIHKRNPSQSNKAHLIEASKIYKNKMNFHINKFNKKVQIKIRKLYNKNPKEYWKILNNFDKKKEQTDIKLDALYTFFKEMNDDKYGDENTNEDGLNIHIDEASDEILNSHITEAEILKCIKSLKTSKACSNDQIINEFLKSTTEIMLPIYVSLFNIIFDTGILPDAWLEGIIKLIYKRKGDPLNPENYRPITILSCFGKLFTSILNSRLHQFLETNNIMEENQAGFRAVYSTTNHIFVLHALTELLKTKKTKLFCAFIDFSKAFDSFWKVGLWMKLLSNYINGKIFRLIYNMYHSIKSCVSYNGERSAYFQSFRGVR